MFQNLIKVLTIEQWNKFQNEEVFLGSALDIKSGFIHLCTKQQLPIILTKFTSGEDEVVILQLNHKSLINDLVFEANKPHGDKYPHYYNCLQKTDVISFAVHKITN